METLTEKDRLQQFLQAVAGIDETEFSRSRALWQLRTYKKGEFYNEYKNVCKYLGFILDGVFRTYYIDGRTGDEKNMFFYSQQQFVVSFKSFVTQTPCNYYTQSMTESSILYIHIEQLQQLYRESHQWERLGRLIAEMAFNISIGRTESFLFQSPEERYLELMQQHPDIFNAVPSYHRASYLGIQGPSLSRIRKRISGR